MALVSVTEYSRIIGKDPSTVRKLLIAGKIKGNKIGNQWVLDDKEQFPEDGRIITGRYRNWRKYARLNHNPLLSSCIKSLVRYTKDAFGDNLNSIILYGSYARGEQTEESDVDIAIRLKSGYSKKTLDKLLDFVSGKEIECGKVLSVIDIDDKKYNEWKDTVPFYKNIEKEGIILWEA